jgi:hypothetical protein
VCTAALFISTAWKEYIHVHIAKQLRLHLQQASDLLVSFAIKTHIEVCVLELRTVIYFLKLNKHVYMYTC